MAVEFTRNQIQELINYLQGSCESLESGVINVLGEQYSENDLSKQDLLLIDDDIFLCDTCGWWCEYCDISIEADENVCEDCHDEEEE